MTTDLVPYDNDFAVAQVRSVFKQITVSLTAVIKPLLDAMADAIRRVAQTFREVACYLDPTLCLPNPSALLCGHVEIHPVDGTKWRVAGRRWDRHWIRSGPRRVRWWK